MTMIGTKTVGSKTWQLGPAAGRRGETDEGRADEGRAKDGARDEGKRLAKSKASLEESERMLSRQTVLLAELRADGFATTEAEKSLVRLEAAVVAQRTAHDGLLAKHDEAADAGLVPS